MSRRWKITVVILAGLLGFIGLQLATMHYQPESEVEAYKQLLRDRGERLEIREVLPPSVPLESNGAEVVRSAFAIFDPSDDWTNLPIIMRMVAPGKAMVGWAQPDVRGGDFTNSWENVVAAAEADRPATELLRQAMAYPAVDFQPDYSKGPETLLPHLAPLKRSAQKLSAAAICDLRDGHPASATTNLCALLALVQGMHDERTVISQLVRIAMTAIAATANWELLQSTNINEADLAALQQGWERLEFVEATENSFLMERASAQSAFKKMRTSSADFNHFIGAYAGSGSGGGGSSGGGLDDLKELWNHTKLTGAIIMWQGSWSYSDELRALQSDQIILEALRTIRTNQCFNPSYTNMTGQLRAMGISNRLDDWFLKFDIPDFRRLFSDGAAGLGAAVRRTMAAEASRRIVISAIALKRFQLKHGNFPEKLSALVPEFLLSVPLDPVDGQPLRYRLNPDGTFLLYCIGEDGVDDGGDPSPPASVTTSNWYWQRGCDWVWPQPATAEEIQAYYDRPAQK